MAQNINEVLFSAEDIKERVKQLGAELAEE